MASQMENLIYHRVDVEDVSHEPIHLYFEGAVEFISNHLEQEQRVLVHCRSGVSRSATIVLAYMVSARRYTLHDAFFLTKSNRSIITPNLGFMDRLCEWEEQELQSDCSIDSFKYCSWYTADERPAIPDLDPDDF